MHMPLVTGNTSSALYPFYLTSLGQFSQPLSQRCNFRQPVCEEIQALENSRQELTASHAEAARRAQEIFQNNLGKEQAIGGSVCGVSGGGSIGGYLLFIWGWPVTLAGLVVLATASLLGGGIGTFMGLAFGTEAAQRCAVPILQAAWSREVEWIQNTLPAIDQTIALLVPEMQYLNQDGDIGVPLFQPMVLKRNQLVALRAHFNQVLDRNGILFPEPHEE